MVDEFEEFEDVGDFAPVVDAEDIESLFTELGVPSDADDYEIPPEATNEQQEEMVEDQVEELEITEMEEGETPAIPEIADNKQPVNNANVSVEEVEEIRAGMGYLSNILEKDELAGLDGDNLDEEFKISMFSRSDEIEIDFSSPEGIYELLAATMGEEMVSQLKSLTRATGKPITEFIDIKTDLEALSSLEILNDRNGRPKFISAQDIAGGIVTDLLGIPTNSDSEIVVTKVYEDSIFTNLENDTSNGYSADGMGSALLPEVREYNRLVSEDQRRVQRVSLLKWIRTLTKKLNEVFGFDDYQQLEALMAAWLMKNSTCRLSGIPGTGKTTVIECAATLLGNSYGYHTSETFYPGKNYQIEKQTLGSRGSDFFADNQSLSNAYVPTVFTKGQYYDIRFNTNTNVQDYEDWNQWRFGEWKQPYRVGKSFDYGALRLSGAYTYDFAFLRPSEKELLDKEGNLLLPAVDRKQSLTASAFRGMLTNCWITDVPVNFTLEAWNQALTELGSVTEVYKKHPQWNISDDKYIESEKKRVVKPLKIFNTKGNAFSLVEAPTYGPFQMRIRYPTYGPEFYAQQLGKKIGVEVIQNYLLATGMDGLYTDCGRNEGYWFRTFMMHFFRDSRATPEESRWADLSAEMLQEIGIAKIDFDKRPDEVLYGLEIQSVERQDASGDTTNTFVFEPEPKPIVTQPVKFFNEANRSQSGVEDAILGLIAERKVEYRGKVFNSPDFVAWMDTNPHQKGNDLAFTDRVDMELLFRSVGLGGRYDQLSGSNNKGGNAKAARDPPHRLVEALCSDEDKQGYYTPMRMADLTKIWGAVGGLSFGETGGGYDGLRDISMISMLFSQIFVKKPTSLADIPYSFAQAGARNVHESPLLDYSTTTNTRTEGEKTSSPVVDFEPANSSFTGVFGDFLGQDNNVGVGQAPTAFTRVLGFRFTNSLVKLSRAIAFLRGKDYVGREEILHAVPYTLAHRLGRSKAGATDVEGNNKGLDGASIPYVNEQEFLRDILVRGYLKQDITQHSMRITDSGDLLDAWNLYYQRCRDIMASVPSVWRYEQQVLLPLHEKISMATTMINDITPIHWHIATMVIDEERKATSKTLRNYAGSFAGISGSPANADNPKTYSQMYDRYQNMILDPTGDGSEPALIDYYRIRGYVARETNLFTNDRNRLLKAIDDEVRAVSGMSVDSPSASIHASPHAVSNWSGGSSQTAEQNDLYDETSSMFPRPQLFSWRTYDDGMGAWGKLIGLGQQQGLTAMRVSSANQNSEMVSGVPLQQGITAINNSQQSMRVITRYPVNDLAVHHNNILDVLKQLSSRFEPLIQGEGYTFTNFGLDTMTMNGRSFKRWISDAERRVREVVTAESSDVASALGELVGVFELAHAPTVTSKVPNYGVNFTQADDNLRLWVRLDLAGGAAGNEVAVGENEYRTLVLTAGLTSALATTRYKPDDKGNGGIGSNLEGETIICLPLSFRPQYLTATYTDQNAWGKSANDFIKANKKALGVKTATCFCLIDLGNMTLRDRTFYGARFRECL